jgi:hypothetical protein
MHFEVISQSMEVEIIAIGSDIQTLPLLRNERKSSNVGR